MRKYRYRIRNNVKNKKCTYNGAVESTFLRSPNSSLNELELEFQICNTVSNSHTIRYE
jgi:hypothetical protein